MSIRRSSGMRSFLSSTAVTLILCAAATASAQSDHGTSPTVDARPETTGPTTIALNPAAGTEIGFVYEAYLSPHQEGGEESDTPAFIPAEFRSTAPSVPRSERTSRGHAVIEFTRDLSRAYVHLAIDNVDPTAIVMLHLHCGRPGQLGPILIDFGLIGDLPAYLADGQLSIEITNADLEAVTATSGGILDIFTRGCPIVPAIPNDRVRTIAGMELIARHSELYFNLHTAGQVYFGDIRGQFHPVALPVSP